MTIEIITAATKTNLTTVAAVKARMGIAETDTSKDIQILTAIKQASDFIVTYCNRVFAQETVKESVAGNGMTTLMLSRTPITEISLIEFDGVPVTDYSITNKSAGLLYRKYGWRWTGLFDGGISGHPIPNSEERVIEVTYTAGFVCPEVTDASRTLPYDIERACIELVRLNLDDTPLNLKSVKIGDYSATFKEEIPAQVTTWLRLWKRVDI